MTDESRSLSPPYISWLTLLGFLDWLGEVGIPIQVDRSFWSDKYSGSTGAQLMTALRYLKLLDGEAPTDSLAELVKADADGRKQLIGHLLRDRYPTVFAIDLARATPKLLNDTFTQLGVDGETSRKAQAFFINACKFAGIQLASGIRRKARNRRLGATRRRRTVPKTEPSDGTPQEPSQPPTQANPEQSTTIKLGGGGTLTLVLNANVLTLEEDDRQFINDLVGRFQAYEAGEEDDGTDEM